MEKPKAIICDLDGTLYNHEFRVDLVDKSLGKKRDFDKYHKFSEFDKPNDWCAETIRLFKDAGYHIIFLTGRPDEYREITEKWILRYLGWNSEEYTLIMSDRSEPYGYIDVDGQKQYKTDAFKRDVYRGVIEPDYNVLMALDDSPKISLMWSEIGVKCLSYFHTAPQAINPIF